MKRATRKKKENPEYYEEDLLPTLGDLIAGVDEVGRGPLAGPVVAAAVIFPPGVFIPGIADSKLLSSKQRESLFPIIKKKGLGIGVGAGSAR